MAKRCISPSLSSRPRSTDSLFRRGALISRNCGALSFFLAAAALGLGLNSISLDSSPLDPSCVRDPPLLTARSKLYCMCANLACLNPMLSLPKISSSDSFVSSLKSSSS